MRVVEIDERHGRTVHEDAVARARVTVAHHLVPIPERTVQRRIVKLTQQSRGCGDLIVGEGTEFRGNGAGNEGERLPAGVVDSHKPWGTIESPRLQMAQEAVNKRRLLLDGPTDGVSNSYDAGRRSPSAQEDFSHSQASVFRMKYRAEPTG